jgi:hypothetical protein
MIEIERCLAGRRLGIVVLVQAGERYLARPNNRI